MELIKHIVCLLVEVLKWTLIPPWQIPSQAVHLINIMQSWAHKRDVEIYSGYTMKKVFSLCYCFQHFIENNNVV